MGRTKISPARQRRVQFKSGLSPEGRHIRQTTLIRLYKRDINGNAVEYWEAWFAEDQLIIHWGRVGTEGQTREIDVSSTQQLASIIENEAASPLAAGYREIPNGELFRLVIQFQAAGMGAPADLDKRHKLEERMNHCLGWNGLGFCDGGDIGSGTMNVFCFVVDSARAVPIVVTELKSIGLLDEATIALSSEDHTTVVWPQDFQGALTI